MQTALLASASPEQTCAIAARLAPRLRAGDVLLLHGDIGAGKTHFARCLIQSLLPVPEDVPSPTFTLVQVYDGPECEIWHADLYRIGSATEVVELGLEDAFDSAICLVEWPDRLRDLAPDTTLDIDLSQGDAEDARRLALAWRAGDWGARLEGLNDD